MKKTLFDKIWDLHEITVLPGNVSLIHIDRHYLHELTGVSAINVLNKRAKKVMSPQLSFATIDHVSSTRPGATRGDEDWSTQMIDELYKETSAHNIQLFNEVNGYKGIVHVVGPELGLSLPGMTAVCGDSHTCTHGALGVIAWGIGSSEVVHVLATQTIRQVRPKTLRINYVGSLSQGVTAKDIALYTIGKLGTDVGTGYAIEYAGQVVEELDMEGRLTLCNLSIELGARIGLIAPDEVTFNYIKGRKYAPKGELWDKALNHWQDLYSDEAAVFDKEVSIDVSQISSQVTWGISPEHVSPINGVIPNPELQSNSNKEEYITALSYMGLNPGDKVNTIPIDRVFIGSCTNSRISDLREAASVFKGRKVSPHVDVWVVPGSLSVKREAEKEGLHKIFVESGAQWREPGCSMCVGANGDIGKPRQRIVSTSNRNFIGRQGPNVRTHLASPAVAAASAIRGLISSPKDLRE